MKKLSLKNLNLEASDLLQREKMKSVLGGNYNSGCLVYCGDTATWLWNNSSMTDDEIWAWYGGCMGGC